MSVHCSTIVHRVHQIERRAGAVRGPCFEAAGVQSEGRDGGERGKMGMEVGRLGASVRREESWENAIVVQLRPPKAIYPPVAPLVPSQTTMTSWSCVNIEN